MGLCVSLTVHSSKEVGQGPVLDGPPSSRSQATGGRQLDLDPTEAIQLSRGIPGMAPSHPVLEKGVLTFLCQFPIGLPTLVTRQYPPPPQAETCGLNLLGGGHPHTGPRH